MVLKSHIQKSPNNKVIITELVKHSSAYLAPRFYYCYKVQRVTVLYLYIVSSKSDLLHIIRLIQTCRYS